MLDTECQLGATRSHANDVSHHTPRPTSMTQVTLTEEQEQEEEEEVLKILLFRSVDITINNDGFPLDKAFFLFISQRAFASISELTYIGKILSFLFYS